MYLEMWVDEGEITEEEAKTNESSKPTAIKNHHHHSLKIRDFCRVYSSRVGWFER